MWLMLHQHFVVRSCGYVRRLVSLRFGSQGQAVQVAVVDWGRRVAKAVVTSFTLENRHYRSLGLTPPGHANPSFVRYSEETWHLNYLVASLLLLLLFFHNF